MQVIILFSFMNGRGQSPHQKTRLNPFKLASLTIELTIKLGGRSTTLTLLQLKPSLASNSAATFASLEM